MLIELGLYQYIYASTRPQTLSPTRLWGITLLMIFSRDNLIMDIASFATTWDASEMSVTSAPDYLGCI